MKRNVKLDDDKMDVYMDIKVSDSAEWNTILPEHAVTVSRRMPTRSDGAGSSRTLDQAELEDLLGELPRV